MKQRKEPFGRPTKYKPEFCEMLIEYMAKGKSYLAFAGTIGVHYDTLYEWEKTHADFSEAKKIGLAKNLDWWETAGIAGLWTSKDAMFNSAVFCFNMKNRHGWRDKSDDQQQLISPIVLSYDPSKGNEKPE